VTGQAERVVERAKRFGRGNADRKIGVSGFDRVAGEIAGQGRVIPENDFVYAVYAVYAVCADRIEHAQGSDSGTASPVENAMGLPAPACLLGLGDGIVPFPANASGEEAMIVGEIRLALPVDADVALRIEKFAAKALENGPVCRFVFGGHS